jgi:phytoene synthase
LSHCTPHRHAAPAAPYQSRRTSHAAPSDDARRVLPPESRGERLELLLQLPLLPEEKRRGITALYAFCREVDDVVDDCTDTAIARTKLAWWRNEVAAMYRGEPQHPVTRALAALLSRFNLPEERLHEIIAGMEMDLDRNRYSNFEALKLYCHRVASVVGLLSAEIFGYGDRRTLDYAADLGWRSS